MIQEFGKIMMGAGLFLLVAGALFYLGGALGLGRLPGDFVFKDRNFTVYFPLATSILLSLILSLAVYFFRR